MDAHEQFARGKQAAERGWKPAARKTLESVQDLLLGALGFPTEAPLSKGAELFSAAIPVVGGAKSALTGAKALTRIKNPIRVWHGSPHNYAAERLIRRADGSMEYLVGKPDVLPDVPPGATVIEDYPLGRARLDKIGTGEGSQSFGYGWNSGEARRVGEAYRDAHSGRLYEANLHVDPDELLDWDAPLSQHKRAQAFAEDLKHGRVDPGDIGGFSRDDQRHVFRSMGPMTTGKRFYSLLGADPSTSDVLRHAGIPGVKYFEGEFRSVDPDVVRRNLAAARAQLARWPEELAAHQREMFQKRIDDLEKTLAHAEANPRTRNYVMFDENRIELVKKFGIALVLGAGLISQAEAEQLKAQGYQ